MTSNSVLRDWNALDPGSAATAIQPCCGSRAWAEALAAERPFFEEQALLTASTRVWFSLAAADWQQAFDSHPRIGERNLQEIAAAAALAWSEAEQKDAMVAEKAEINALRNANARYEQRFGCIFIIRARGRSAREILSELDRRLLNTPEAELLEAADQQSEITDLRLRHWLAGT